MAQVSLLIIYQQTMKATAFLPLHMVQVAGWLRLIPQAEQKSTWLSTVALCDLPSPYIKTKAPAIDPL
jgi:hypothetical protein